MLVHFTNTWMSGQFITFLFPGLSIFAQPQGQERCDHDGKQRNGGRVLGLLRLASEPVQRSSQVRDPGGQTPVQLDPQAAPGTGTRSGSSTSLCGSRSCGRWPEAVVAVDVAATVPTSDDGSGLMYASSYGSHWSIDHGLPQGTSSHLFSGHASSKLQIINSRLDQ